MKAAVCEESLSAGRGITVTRFAPRPFMGSSTMPDYRAYIVGIDGQFNSIITEFPDNHLDDAAAIEAAEKLDVDHDIELWDGDRFVGRFSPSHRARAS